MRVLKRGLSVVARRVPSLRVRMGIAALLAISAFSFFVALQSADELSVAYSHAGRDEVLAIARTFSDDFAKSQLDRPAALRDRLASLKRLNPNLTQIAMYRRDRGRGTVVASVESSVASRQARRSTARPALAVADQRLFEPSDLLPLDTARPSYKEAHEEGKHLAEVTFPLFGPTGGPVAVLGLYYDLGPRDVALASQEKRVGIAAAVTALLLLVFFSQLLGRSVFRPLHRLRVATRRIKGGELHARLGWTRADEFGAVARDFDAMAEQLEESHARLSELALRDPLTGLFNNRSFQDALDRELARCKRYRGRFGVVMLDLDGFKLVNDSKGHAAGDLVLDQVARVLTSQCRPSDIVARVGGDEFAILLPESGRDAAIVLGERISHAVENLDARVGISFGVAEWPTDGPDKEAVLLCADMALYSAKPGSGDRRGGHGHAVSGDR